MMLVIGLALAALSGCGPAREGAPVQVGVATSTSPAASPSASPAATSRTRPAVPVRKKPARTRPAAGTVRGPADSLMRTGDAGVALSFDDGPDPVQTPRMLDLLRRHGVKATFCLVGRNAAAHPDLVRRIVAEGHTLCNHTWRHSLTLGKRKAAVIEADLRRTNDAIRAAAPGAQIRYVRAPGGNFTGAFVAAGARLGMKSIYWQVDPRDWEHPGGESGAAHRAKVVRSVKKHVHKGAIVLSHDYGQPETIAAYEQLLPWLKGRYRLVALP
ncbi:peptidoglycan/xylan/chitin deacetylase (PgdA/CDA1 family) [Actinoplanes digitatis]|uniref:Peptidoglycan/xylan/chitin deacetylase (PgdA/CDA1 family) n=2 Tax=Actinoplanes digitatis TaxID=1868 RepID=A0A7W7I4P3_9ACTN|nr:peptidoglycan/xylan/chitin deacetylase (PgdA/CDA1 family) [Actinoplanes digitatis]